MGGGVDVSKVLYPQIQVEFPELVGAWKLRACPFKHISLLEYTAMLELGVNIGKPCS